MTDTTPAPALSPDEYAKVEAFGLDTPELSVRPATDRAYYHAGWFEVVDEEGAIIALTLNEGLANRLVTG